jgi:hypothetical protein
MPNNIDSDIEHFIPYIRATKYMNVKIEGNMMFANYKNLMKGLEKLKKEDKNGKNKGGIINVDTFITIVLSQKYMKSSKDLDKVTEE